MIGKIKNKIYYFSQKWGKKIGLDLPYFIKNGFWMMVRQLVDIASGLVPFIIFARFISKDVFGEYQFFLALLSTISIVSLPGLNVSVLRSVSRGFDGDYKKSVKSSFFWSLLGTPILLLLGFYYFYIGRVSLGISLMIASVFFPLIYAPNTWNAFLQGKNKYKLLFSFSSAQSIMNSLAIIIVVFLNRNNLVLIVIFYLISYTFFNCLYYWKSLKYIENDKQSMDGLGYGRFLTIMNTFQVIADNIDKVILGVLMPPSAVAAFGVISLIPIKARGVLKAFFAITFPKMSRDNFSLSNLWKNNKKIIFLFLGFNIFLGLIYFLIINKITLLFFGKNYINFYGYSRIFTIFVSIGLPLSLLSWYIQAKKITGALIVTNPIYLAFKLIITVFFVYYWGILGCVWAYNLNTVILFIMYLFFIIKNTNNKVPFKIQ